MADPATSELHKRRVSGETQRHAESPSLPLKSAIKTASSSETNKISKTVSFDAGPRPNGEPIALQESLELEDLPLDSVDQDVANGVEESEGEDDLVVYNEAEEGDTLSGSLSELSRRGTMDSELSTGASGSGRRGEIESLLLAPVDDFDDSSSEDSLLDKNGGVSATPARNREMTDLDRPVYINTAMQSNRTVDIASPASAEAPPRKNGKSRSMSYGSPITLNRPEFSNCPPMGGFAEVPLMLTNQGGPFDGLVHCDTVDALGRPVVVLNTSALPKKSQRNQAFSYISESLEPIIAQGPYVLMFASFQSETLAKVPAAWVVGAYRKLSRPFKKNVEFVVLVRPNRVLKGLLKVMSLVVKKKAKRKVKQIKYLTDIETVTNGEVGIQHLGPKVIALMGQDGLPKNGEN